MAEDARLAYLQARLQARHGDRPAPDDWRLVESSTDLSHYLDALRRTALKRWIGDLNHEMEPEAIERQLRANWRDTVHQVAGWAPPEWREAVDWLRWLPDLPAIDHLLRGLQVPSWMRADPVMRELAFDEPQRRREALGAMPLAAVFTEHPTISPNVTEAWIAGWRQRLPEVGGELRRGLESLLEAVRGHVEAMRSSEAPDGRALRSQLVARAARSFRRGAGTAVAMFSHLVLDGLELERIRAGIVTRRLMPQRAEGRTWA